MAKVKNCRVCGNAVSSRVKSCPNCGEPTTSILSKLIKTLIGIVIVFSGCAYCISSIDLGEVETVSWDEQNAEVSAYSECQKAVQNQLKSPSTADFQGIFEGRYDNVVRANQRYFFTSYVDAQNGFGAVIRTNFECSVTQINDGVWQLNRLTIID